MKIVFLSLLVVSAVAYLEEPTSIRFEVDLGARTAVNVKLAPGADAFLLAVSTCREVGTPETYAACVSDIMSYIRQERADALMLEAREIVAAAEEMETWLVIAGRANIAAEAAATSTADAARALLESLEIDKMGAHSLPWAEEIVDNNGGVTGVLAGSISTAAWPPFDLLVHPARECRYLSDSIGRFGYYDPMKSVRIASLLRAASAENPGEAIFVDVGAHVGWFTFLAASVGAEVLAIEPLAYNHRLLNRSLALTYDQHRGGQPTARRHCPVGGCSSDGQADGGWPASRGRVALVPVAVGREPGTVCLHVARGGDGPSNQGNARALALGSAAAAQDVAPEPCAEWAEVETLDRLVPRHLGAHRAVSVLKLDIEGAEAAALAGASGLLGDPDRRPCVVVAEHLGGTHRTTGGGHGVPGVEPASENDGGGQGEGEYQHGEGRNTGLFDVLVSFGYLPFDEAGESAPKTGDLPTGDYEFRCPLRRCEWAHGGI